MLVALLACPVVSPCASVMDDVPILPPGWETCKGLLLSGGCTPCDFMGWISYARCESAFPRCVGDRVSPGRRRGCRWWWLWLVGNSCLTNTVSKSKEEAINYTLPGSDWHKPPPKIQPTMASQDLKLSYPRSISNDRFRSACPNFDWPARLGGGAILMDLAYGWRHRSGDPSMLAEQGWLVQHLPSGSSQSLRHPSRKSTWLEQVEPLASAAACIFSLTYPKQRTKKTQPPTPYRKLKFG